MQQAMGAIERCRCDHGTRGRGAGKSLRMPWCWGPVGPAGYALTMLADASLGDSFAAFLLG